MRASNTFVDIYSLTYSLDYFVVLLLGLLPPCRQHSLLSTSTRPVAVTSHHSDRVARAEQPPQLTSAFIPPTSSSSTILTTPVSSHHSATHLLLFARSLMSAAMSAVSVLPLTAAVSSSISRGRWLCAVSAVLLIHAALQAMQRQSTIDTHTHNTHTHIRRNTVRHIR